MSEKKSPHEDPRVRLAAERTLLAWVRTSLAMMGFGFVVSKFGLFSSEFEAGKGHVEDLASTVSLCIGVLLVVAAVLANVAAARDYLVTLKRLNAGEPHLPPRWHMGITIAVLLALLGAALAVYLVWSERHTI